MFGGIQSSPFDAAFIRSIADLCRGMGIAVCIEGIETQEQQAILKDIPVNLWQGFLFGRPMPADELETFVDQGKDASQTGVRAACGRAPFAELLKSAKQYKGVEQ